VWLLNGEEDQDELDRRIAAVCQRFGISQVDLGGRLFVQSVRKHPLRVATMVKNIATPNPVVLDHMRTFIDKNHIDVFMVDPLVSFHGAAENDNGQMDVVIKEAFGGIAETTRSAGELFHHPGKPKPGAPETVVEDARGASAIINAVRCARVMNFMTTEFAKQHGIDEEHRRLHVQIANGKANAGPTGSARWIKLEVENLANGDSVACATNWKPTDPFSGVTTADMLRCRNVAQAGAYRADSQAKDWFGYAVAKVLGIDVTYDGYNDPKDVARIKEILSIWFKNKVLAKERRQDEGRKEREYVIPGPWKPEPPSPTHDPNEEPLS
jgi:hypothetical protein